MDTFKLMFCNRFLKIRNKETCGMSIYSMFFSRLGCSYQFRSIRIRFKGIDFILDVMRQSACEVIKQSLGLKCSMPSSGSSGSEDEYLEGFFPKSARRLSCEPNNQLNALYHFRN